MLHAKKLCNNLTKYIKQITVTVSTTWKIGYVSVWTLCFYAKKKHNFFFISDKIQKICALFSVKTTV